jgi:hypothetical protein
MTQETKQAKRKRLYCQREKRKATLKRVWTLSSTNLCNLQQPILKGWLYAIMTMILKIDSLSAKIII